MVSGVTPDAALARLTTLHPKIIDLSLDRVWRLLGDLGNPQEHLPPVIHVAGTNGKGSTVAFLRAFFEAAGLRVHAYTSPHLVHFNERIRVAGEIISDSKLVSLLEEVEAANGNHPITFFEVTTCAALLAFSRTPADVVLLETGLGGRLDATNVVKRPALTILTPISMDHEQYLGGHIEAIAAEKAHILKPGVPCVVAKQSRKANQIIELRSLEVGVPTFVEGRDWHVVSRPDSLVYQGRAVTWTLPLPALPGTHQHRNAGLALAAIERLLPQFAISPEAVATGMRTVTWPARLQRLTTGPLVDALPADWELWLDGGHNPDAGKTLAAFLRGWKDQPLDAICGMMGPKDAAGYLEPMAPRIRRFRAVTVPDEPNAKPAAELVETARRIGMADPAEAPDVSAAMAELVANADAGPRRVLICGSLYLAGTVLAQNA